MTPLEQAQQWLGVPFALGGRDRRGIDCLGVARVVCAALGLPVPDPWPELAAAWQSTGDARAALVATGFPPGWVRIAIPTVAPDGLVGLTASIGCGNADLGHVGAVVAGWWFSARPEAGVYATPWARVRPLVQQAWRHNP